MGGQCEKFKSHTSLLLRVGLGVVFTYHGYNKVFGEAAALGTSWNPHGMPAILQALVSWGELLAGVGLLIGFLTPIAALGIIVIMAGAIITVHGKNGFSMMNGGYEYNFVIIAMCLALIANGPGEPSVDSKFCKKTDPASSEPNTSS